MCARACDHACVSVWSGWARSGRMSREELWECPRCVRVECVRLGQGLGGGGPTRGARAGMQAPRLPSCSSILLRARETRVAGLSKERACVVPAPPLTLCCPRRHPPSRWALATPPGPLPAAPGHPLAGSGPGQRIRAAPCVLLPAWGPAERRGRRLGRGCPAARAPPAAPLRAVL